MFASAYSVRPEIMPQDHEPTSGRTHLGVLWDSHSLMSEATVANLTGLYSFDLPVAPH